MEDRDGITRTAKEAIMCKLSSNFLRSDEGTDNAAKKRPQNPLLNRIYHSRYQVVHKTLSKCLNFLRALNSVECIKGKQNQILILGAGIDISFEESYSKSNTIFAVDLHEIINERNIALHTAETRSEHKIGHPSRSLSISIVGDLRSFDDIWKQLLIKGFDSQCPTVVLIECVLCYIDTSAVQQLLMKLSKLLCNKSFLIMYDPMLPPSDSSSHFTPSSSTISTASSLSNLKKTDFKQMMSNKFESRKAPIRHSIKSKGNQCALMKSCNWNYLKVFNMFEAQHYFLTAEERSVSILSEPFDEYSSLALLHNLYGITLAGLDSNLFHTMLRQSYQGNEIENAIISTSNTGCLVPNTFIPVIQSYSDVTTDNFKTQNIFLSNNCSDRKNSRSTSNDQNERCKIDLFVRSVDTGGTKVNDVEILQKSSTTFEEHSLRTIFQRIVLAESRLYSFIQREAFNFREAEGGMHISIREGCDSDSAAVCELFSKSFEAMSNKFVAVKKFVKNSIKKLKSIEKYYPKNEGSNFWVVEINKENVEDQSQSNGKILIGCVGFKRTRTSLKFFPPESVEKNLKSSKILNVENGFQESSYPRAGVKDRGEVTHLCVDSLYRRKGMGKILMDVMINWAKECSSNMVTDNKLIECEIQNTPGRLNEISVGVSVDEVGRMPFGSGGKEIECKESTIPLNSIDLTVLTELIPAIELYEQLGFKNEDQPVDLGGGCYLQHMTMRI